MARVDEVARELGLTTGEVIEELNALGHPVASHVSSVEADAVADLRAHLENGRKRGDAKTEEVPVEEVGGASSAKAAEWRGADASRETETKDFEQWRAAGTARVPEAGWSAGSSPPEAREAPAPPREGPVEERTAPGERGGERGRSWLAHQLMELPLLVGFAFLIAVVIKTFLAQAFFIPSPSMRPTLQEGDRVLVEKLSLRFTDPGRGNIVVFAKEVFGAPQDLPWYEDARNFLRELLGLPTGNEEDYIKRVVAVGGDVIRYAGKPRRLTVNGEPVEEPYIAGRRDRTSQTLTREDCKRLEMVPRRGGCLVPEGSVFVMGDNRGNSEDSRVIGPISEDKILGRAFVVIWPPRQWGGL